MPQEQGEMEATSASDETSQGGVDDNQENSGGGSGFATIAAASLAAGASYMVAKRVLGNTGESGSSSLSLKGVGSKVKDVGSQVGSQVKEVGSSSQQNGKANGDGSSGSSGASRSADSLRGLMSSATWSHAQELALPFAERAAASAGEFVAREAPDVVSERLIPRFIDAFNKARSKA